MFFLNHHMTMRLVLGVAILLCAHGLAVADSPPASPSDSSVSCAAPASTASTDLAEESPSGAKTSIAKPTRGRPSSSAWKKWKRRLPFWPRKGMLILELSVFIALGVVLAQVLEVSGIVRYLAVIAWPLTALGKLKKEVSPAFLMAFQSGAIANSMLVSSLSDGSINRRELYTSVLVVSCLSLFAHLPTYVLPIGMVLGMQATMALFGVRFVAIILEIILVLTLSRVVIRPWLMRRAGTTPADVTPEQLEAARESRRKAEKRLRQQGSFWRTVWKRSHRTLRRLLLNLIPTYTAMAFLEYGGFFRWLANEVPGLFQFSFLPPESAAIIPAQAMSLYNGATVAASCVDSGAITVEQAVLTILIGSMVTAPIRTLKHALPTYLAVLGPRAGLIMAITAQVLRIFFMAVCTVALWIFWNG
jgi:hypothetical protein